MLAALAAVLPSGCASHVLREGIWKLTMNTQIATTQTPLGDLQRQQQVESLRVRVELDWSEDGEEVTVTPLEGLGTEGAEGRRTYRNLEPSQGLVAAGRDDFKLTIADSYWIFQLFGKVLTPEKVAGRLVGRLRIEEVDAIDGSWLMTWEEPDG
jgi:hypothetical protein